MSVYSSLFFFLVMILALSLPTVEPVINSRSVGVRLVKDLRSHGPVSKVTPRVKNTPPHVVLACRWRRSCWCSWCCWCLWCRRHRQRPRIFATIQLPTPCRFGSSSDIKFPELAEASLRLRPCHNIVPYFIQHLLSLDLSQLVYLYLLQCCCRWCLIQAAMGSIYRKRCHEN